MSFLKPKKGKRVLEKMEITLKDIGKFAAEFLHVLEREDINSSEVLEKRAQRGRQEFMINVQESLVIMLRPSQMVTLACTMSYTVQGVGIPIELRINKQLDYTKSIIKSIKIIPEYSKFAEDEFGNIIQDTSWKGSELSKSIEHLRKLESYGKK